MREQLLAYAIQAIADSPPDTTAVKVAALTLVGVVAATAGSVFIALRSPKEERDHGWRESRSDEQFHQTLKAQLGKAQAELTTARSRAEAYERFFWKHHMDPRRISTGDESADDVRI